MTLAGLGLMAVLLLLSSALGWALGPPTFAVGAGVSVFVLWRRKKSPWPVLRGVSWSVLPLVAGLFIMLGALDRLGLAVRLGRAVAGFGLFQSAAALAVLSNLVNNLPAGLLAGQVFAGAAPAQKAAALIAVDLGPNLSITGSLATILWLAALRRQGESITGWRFLRLGLVMMPPALALALYALRVAV
jgi:arsenical pump membrane protein